jgi:hypothetical protein
MRTASMIDAHITVDYKEIKKGETHRVGGWHVDGFQGCKFPEKHEIEHSYLWASSSGTEFCAQPFFISHIDDSKYLIFDEFAKQANECNVIKSLDKMCISLILIWYTVVPCKAVTVQDY